MENILQSIVKIIIIGSLYTSGNVNGNRQFLPPPLPYYQNDDFFLPGFVPPYYDPVPVYYGEPQAPPPVSFQSVNPYAPPQLFHQSENYNPAQLTNPGHPGMRHPMPHIFHYNPNPYHPLGHDQKNFQPPRVNYKKPSRVQAGSPPEAPQRKPVFYATNIIVKDENQPSYYHDEYNKNYHEEDYTDNYSDESPSPPDPCLLNSRYRVFESSKANPNDPNVDKLTLCNPYFQPNFGNNVYTVKMPITLLPSRFPPRVEQLIERIQNYFSTYTQQGTPKPQNETSPVVQPVVTEAAIQTEAPTPPTIITGNTDKKNTTTEIEELALVETSPEPSEVATTGVAAATAGTPATAANEVTQKTIVVEVEATDEETFSTVVPQAHVEAYIVKAVQNAETANEVTEKVVGGTESFTHNGEVLQVSQQNFPAGQVQKAEGGASSERTSENQISNKWSPSYTTAEMHTHPVDLKATESTETEISNRTEESNAIQSTRETLLEVTDQNG